MKRRWIAAFAALLTWTSLNVAQTPDIHEGVVPAPEANGVPVLASDSWTGDAWSAEESPSRFWANADYLLWWIKGTPTPPLVSTGDRPDVRPGALDQPNTRVLFGGEKVEFDGRSGYRLGAGTWLGVDGRNGVEGSYFWLERASRFADFQSDAAGEPFIGRPFIDNDGRENVFFASFPARFDGLPLAGGTSVSTDTRVWGWDVNLLRQLGCGDRAFRVTALVGYRQLVLKESLIQLEDVRDDSGTLVFLNQRIPATGTLLFLDSFETHNRFYGGQVGAKVDWKRDQIRVSLTGKLALGTTEQLTFIKGATTLVAPDGGTTTAAGGILAQASNIGRHFEREFSIVPELALNVAYDVTSCISVRAGYTFLYWNKVARPGDQIDRTINLNQVPTDLLFGTPGGAARPAVLNNTTDFWLHGVNTGVEVRF